MAEIKFEESIPELLKLIEKRKSKWRLQQPEWEDVKQEILIRIWQKFDQYDSSKGPLENWANVVITRAIINLLRDNIYKSARPCISANQYGNPCYYNTGENTCGFTKSGLQCEECKAFAKWKKSYKEIQFNLNTPLSLENHVDESKKNFFDSVDIADLKIDMDKKMLERLSVWDAKLYKFVYIDNLSKKQICKKLKMGDSEESEAKISLQITKAKSRFKLLATEILEEIGLS